MASAITKIERKILFYQGEIDRLKAAMKVLRELEAEDEYLGDAPDGEPVWANGKKDLIGQTVVSAAQKILSEASAPMHFKEVFEVALSRGWRGRTSAPNPQSFWSLMKRSDDVFEAAGGGKFRLKKEAEN